VSGIGVRDGRESRKRVQYDEVLLGRCWEGSTEDGFEIVVNRLLRMRN